MAGITALQLCQREDSEEERGGRRRTGMGASGSFHTRQSQSPLFPNDPSAPSPSRHNLPTQEPSCLSHMVPCTHLSTLCTLPFLLHPASKQNKRNLLLPSVTHFPGLGQVPDMLILAIGTLPTIKCLFTLTQIPEGQGLLSGVIKTTIFQMGRPRPGKGLSSRSLGSHHQAPNVGFLTELPIAEGNQGSAVERLSGSSRDHVVSCPPTHRV